ncbi:MAG: 16S rRNA (adenine(1518)-N(6)/adenine(1519)-N(6))-dimethyltransferase RsmA [Halobacteriaceae archaeon]
MTGQRDPDDLIERAGSGDPGRDQYFLVDDRVLDRLPRHLDADFGHVLEVGAGTGALTDRLLAAADTVTAIERDPALASFLREEFAAERSAGRLTVVEGDALEVDLPEFSASVSNLPYGISSPMLFRLLPRDRPLLVLVQREFAERMAAEAGTDEYGRLSVTAQHYADIDLVEPVPPTAFDPSPPVESMVVRTTPRPPAYEVTEPVFMAVVRAVFTQRRKTLRNALRNTTHISGIETIDPVLEAVPDDRLDARPGELDPAALAAVARSVEAVGGVV